MSGNVKDIGEARRKKPPATVGGDWARGLILTEEGTPKRNLANTMHVLGQHPEWSGVLAYDLFAESIVKLRPPPTRKQDEPEAKSAGPWTEADSVRAATWIASTVGFDAAVQWVDAAVATVAERNLIHPVRDWLRELEWDHVERLDRMLVTYFGADDSNYTRAVGAKWMISAVARVEQPGCKADHMLVLESKAQGIGKSTALRILASDPWFSDTGIIIGDKDSFQAMRRVWIYELAELSSIRGRDVERVKTFLSSPSDRYRPSYGRVTREFPRQTVFAGSTNEEHYLTDPTGARRFWPVKCRSIDLEGLRRDRDQLWAEAKHRFTKGEKWHLEQGDIAGDAAKEQADRAERDDWIDVVADWLTCPTVPDAQSAGREATRHRVSLADGVTTAQVLLGALNFAPERITPGATKRVGHVLRTLGFTPRQARDGVTRTRRYERTCDSTCDTSTAEKGSCHTSQVVTGDSTHTQERGSG
jgi:putative DNA primase/helicase